MNPKVQFGCGENPLDGWRNHDADVDVTKKLPYIDNSIHAIFCEHLAEHLTPQQVWNFFEECHRILESGGLIRITVPCASRIYALADAGYNELVKSRGWGDGTLQSSVKAIVFQHGHQSVWGSNLMRTFLECCGFKNVESCVVGVSKHPELNDIERHWRKIGHDANLIESISTEGQKCST